MAFGDILGYANGYLSQINGSSVEYLDTTEPVIQIPIIELNKPLSELWSTSDKAHWCDWDSEITSTMAKSYSQLLPHMTMVELITVPGITFSVGCAEDRLFTFSPGTVNSVYKRSTYKLSVSSRSTGKMYTMVMDSNVISGYQWGFTFGYSPEAGVYFPVEWTWRNSYGTIQKGVSLSMLTSSEPYLTAYWPTTLDLYDPEEIPIHPPSMTLGWMAGRQTAAMHHHP